MHNLMSFGLNYFSLFLAKLVEDNKILSTLLNFSYFHRRKAKGGNDYLKTRKKDQGFSFRTVSQAPWRLFSNNYRTLNRHWFVGREY